MRLTRVLMYYKRLRKIPGRLDIGKHQLVKPVTSRLKIMAVNELLIDHENWMYLQKPFLNEEVEKHVHVIEQRYLDGLEEKHKDEYTLSKLKPAMKTEDHVGHLNTTKCWE